MRHVCNWISKVFDNQLATADINKHNTVAMSTASKVCFSFSVQYDFAVRIIQISSNSRFRSEFGQMSMKMNGALWNISSRHSVSIV